MRDLAARGETVIAYDACATNDRESSNPSARRPVTTRAVVCLDDCERVQRAADAAREPEGCRDEEELVHPVAGELLEVEVLDQVAAEIAEDGEVDERWLRFGCVRYRDLDRAVVSSDGDDVAISKPRCGLRREARIARVESLRLAFPPRPLRPSGPSCVRSVLPCLPHRCLRFATPWTNSSDRAHERIAPVDAESDTGDMPCVLGREEGDGTGDVVGRCQAS